MGCAKPKKIDFVVPEGFIPAPPPSMLKLPVQAKPKRVKTFNEAIQYIDALWLQNQEMTRTIIELQNYTEKLQK